VYEVDLERPNLFRPVASFLKLCHTICPPTIGVCPSQVGPLKNPNRLVFADHPTLIFGSSQPENSTFLFISNPIRLVQYLFRI
jgi:hypothetical protein